MNVTVTSQLMLLGGSKANMFTDVFSLISGIMGNNRIEVHSSSIIRGVLYYLILTLALNILNDLKNILKTFMRGELPIWTNFKLDRDENEPESHDFSKGHLTNKYVSKMERRYHLSLREATNETLTTVSIQVRLILNFIKTCP